MKHILTQHQYDELQGIAALLANLEGFGSGDQEATLEEITSFGTSLLEIIEDEADRQTDTERDTVLAALRFWQRCGNNSELPEYDIALNGRAAPLDNDEIDTLCERLNS